MTPLAVRLRERIATEGPISLSVFMAEALLDPDHGYYRHGDPLGRRGDFTTAPEISQMFGELLGLALAQAWHDQGAPDTFALVELGPGRGTLMSDLLRATRIVPGFHEALSLHLVEASETLRRVQAERLPGATWHESVETLPEGTLFLVANEFFDALPIRQFHRVGAGWQETLVGCHADGALYFGRGPTRPVATLAEKLDSVSDGEIVEISPSLPAIVSDIGRRIAAHGGAALVIDYGDWRGTGDTFQAVTAHKFTDPLAQPGQADLTAHVDFEAIARAAQPALCTKLCPQGIFLTRLGIDDRAGKLAKNLTGTALKSHLSAYRRLTHVEEMGQIFKVLGLYPKGAPPIAGLELGT